MKVNLKANSIITKDTRKAVSGFTLVEMLVAVAIVSIFSIGLLSLQTAISKNQISVVSNFTNVEEANKIVSEVVKELRSARDADNGVFAFENMQDNEIIFYSDIDHDDQAEKVRYSLSQGILEKGVIEPEGQPVSYPQNQERVKQLSTNVVNNADTEPLFFYYNQDWPVDTVNNPLIQELRTNETKTIKISVKLNTRDDSKSDYQVESSTQIRLLKQIQ